jgi:hypothetical protein
VPVADQRIARRRLRASVLLDHADAHVPAQLLLGEWKRLEYEVVGDA